MDGRAGRVLPSLPTSCVHGHLSTRAKEDHAIVRFCGRESAVRLVLSKESEKQTAQTKDEEKEMGNEKDQET